VFFATREGQTRRIAERIAEQIRKHGLDSRAVAIISEESSHIDWSRVRGVALGASLHMQKHQGEAVAFAHVHHAPLSERPSLFFSVSLSAGSKRPDEVLAAQQLADRFCADTGWQPSRIACVAGRLAYSQYNWLVRMMMRRIARKEGGSTDTSSDHEYTNWLQVEELADELAYEVRRREIFPAPDGVPHLSADPRVDTHSPALRAAS
jgi:menaquinone-dependent protoporphyrinogen oxidase